MSKDELRSKLSELYKSNKDQVSCFGFRTRYGGGKSTGFALIYDSNDAMKQFEPHYRLVRYGMATKIEKASRQQRTYTLGMFHRWAERQDWGATGWLGLWRWTNADNAQQASRGRTARRSSGVRRRRRAHPRTRRNKGMLASRLRLWRWRKVTQIASGLRPSLHLYLHDLVRIQCQHGVHHAPDITHQP